MQCGPHTKYLPQSSEDADGGGAPCEDPLERARTLMAALAPPDEPTSILAEAQSAAAGGTPSKAGKRAPIGGNRAAGADGDKGKINLTSRLAAANPFKMSSSTIGKEKPPPPSTPPPGN